MWFINAITERMEFWSHRSVNTFHKIFHCESGKFPLSQFLVFDVFFLYAHNVYGKIKKMGQTLEVE